MNDLIIREQDLIQNPSPRLPICLVLDTSASMEGKKIDELNNGVRTFFTAVRNDETAKYSAEIAVVTFGGIVKKELDFASIERQQIPILRASGSTPMEEGVNLALDLLEEAKGQYKKVGVDYYQPWMVLMTDGQPDEIPINSSQRTRDLINRKKLVIFPIGIGKDADMDLLKSFSPKKPPLRLKGLKFNDFFEWLSKSVSIVSQSMPGEDINLDLDAISNWGTL